MVPVQKSRTEDMTLTQVFVFLQLLDLLTTLLGLRLGAREASPFVRLLMHAGPTFGVAASKVFALGLGAFCVHTRRFGLIRIASYWYGCLVAWNLIVLLAVPHRFGL